MLTTRISLAQRDQIRRTAGWGALQLFVSDAVLAAIEKATTK